MTANDPRPPFTLQVGWDQAELLGARWWQEGLLAAGEQPTVRAARGGASGGDQRLGSRRAALQKLVLLGGGVVVAGVVLRGCFGGRGSTTVTTVDRASLDLQREQGLAVGAENERFVWPDARDTTEAGQLPDAGLLGALANDLRPPDPADQPDHVTTLLQCTTVTGGAAFAAQLRPILSPAMQVAFGRGEAIRELLAAAAKPAETAFVVDLPGPESVAFAAALQPRATALFTFDNWPHPRGVVPSHLTLGAIVWYRDRFAATAAAPDPARARVYVLDRDRLAPYGGEPSRFDNRYVAKLPSAASLRARGVQRVIYVVPEGGPVKELDDLAERFVEYERAQLPVRMLGLADVTLGEPAADASGTKGSGQQRYWWHGSPLHHWWFWSHFGGRATTPLAPQQPPRASFGDSWRAVPRVPVPGLTSLGRTQQQVRSSGGSSSGSGGRTGGSWGRSSGSWGGS
jgi:hypothetical protein